MKILVENSTWNNIGDGFYQSTLYVLLKRLYPNDTVLMGEGPVNRSFHPSSKYLQNSFHLMNHQTADVHIFSGPILHSVVKEYGDKIKEIKAKGNNYAFISVSCAGISPSVLTETISFLKKYPPLLLSTRDPDTYQKFHGSIDNVYNGFCTAFLVGKLLPVDEIKPDFKFFISSFYTELEPFYRANGEVNIDNIEVDRKKTFLGLNHRLTRHFNYLRPQQEYCETHKILRVHQELGTKFYNVKFSHPNSFMSFNLLSYLALYKSSDFTISDRVHSCAVSLAFGKPARLFTESPRAGIFERLGYNYKKSGDIMYPIDGDIIENELGTLKDKIKSLI